LASEILVEPFNGVFCRYDGTWFVDSLFGHPGPMIGYVATYFISSCKLIDSTRDCDSAVSAA
jgi:hypothetical protein